MGKIALLFSIGLLYSCTFGSNKSSSTKDTKRTLATNVTKEFKYKKHSYIMFSNGNGVGVVHDPECAYCYNKFD